MTRILTIIALLFTPILLVGCAERISVDPLPQNDWGKPDSAGNLFIKLKRIDNKEKWREGRKFSKMSEHAPEELTLVITSYTENTCLTCSKNQRKIYMWDLNWMDFDKCADRLVTEERSRRTSTSGFVDGEYTTLYGKQKYEVNVLKKRAAAVKVGNMSDGRILDYEHGHLGYSSDRSLIHEAEWSNNAASTILRKSSGIFVTLIDYCSNGAVYVLGDAFE